MLRVVLALAVLLAAVGCQAPNGAAQPKSLTPQMVALRQGDVAGMQRCAGSGDVVAVLADEKATNPAEYQINLTEWTQWKIRGATDAYVAIFGRTAADCASLSGSGTGTPPGELMVGLVVKFKDAAIAARSYRSESTLFGFGQKDITFIRLAGGQITTGTQTGLGPDSSIGSGVVAGARYYFALWQNKSFESDLLAYNVASADADLAAKSMNQRIH
ncbi:MAG: hypothetical protein E6J20_15535 [Chloroflexi bacterium]|nr:MAG: hypothetical protein E6J20_15535 [Chloroflexota bacterium]